MKRRLAIIVAAVMALGGLGSLPAHADFHGFCTSGTQPKANVTLSVSGATPLGATLKYEGYVKCVGTTVSIDSLNLTAVDANGQTAPPALAASCTACTAALNPSATYAMPPGPGTYALKMAFTVTATNGTVVHRMRTERAAWAGAGSLTLLCGGNDQANQQGGCPVS